MIEMKSATDEQMVEAAEVALKAAIESLEASEIFGDFGLRDGIEWRKFSAAMDAAYQAAQTSGIKYRDEHELDFIFIDEKHICASAAYALLNELDEEPHPYCEGAVPLLCIGQWIVRRELAAQMEMVEEDGKDLLPGKEESPESESDNP